MSSHTHVPEPLHNPVALTPEPPPAASIAPEAPSRARLGVAVTSFLFILLQSFCTFAMAVSGVRLVIGAGALAGAVGLLHHFGHYHRDLYRIPMMVIALGGSLLDLYLIRRIRTLRARPSSQWRMAAPTPHQLRSENFQIALSIITLALLAIEELGHILYHGL